jgi:release factor glutamine methyltransferase
MDRPATPAPASSAPAAAGGWTTRRLLDWMTGAFESKGLDEPRLCAEMLLADTLGCQRLRLYMEADRPASDAERERLRALVARALKHEPIQYLIGRWPFFGIELKCDRRALIPRPSTETIVESVLQWRRAVEGPPKSSAAKISDFEQPDEAPGGGATGALEAAATATSKPTSESAPPEHPAEALAPRIADICCGGGAIAIALAKNLPRARIIATDLSEDALTLAAENIAEQGLEDRIELRHGDLLAPLAGAPTSEAPFDIIVSNPPYIPDDEWADVEPNVRDYEPEMALRAGPDGMTFVRPILEGAGALLAPGGRILIEVAASRADHARDLAAACGLRDPVILKDIDGLPRIILAHRAG